MDKRDLIVMAEKLALKTSKSSAALSERILRSALISSDNYLIQKRNFFLYMTIAVDNLEAISGEINNQSKEEFIRLVKDILLINTRNGNIEVGNPDFEQLNMKEWSYIIGWAKKLNANNLHRENENSNFSGKDKYKSKRENNSKEKKTNVCKTETGKGFNMPFADKKLDELFNK